jgi:hypothetical protein
MRSKLIVRSALTLFVVTVFTASLSAQRGEIYPNAGFFWPDTMNNGQRIRMCSSKEASGISTTLS